MQECMYQINDYQSVLEMIKKSKSADFQFK
jgi:hypothetical protein